MKASKTKLAKAAPATIKPSTVGGKLTVDMEDVFDSLLPHAKKRTLKYNVFTSRAYDTGRRRMKAAGADLARQKEFAREQFLRASTLWLAHQPAGADID